jgi:hypothetical protein
MSGRELTTKNKGGVKTDAGKAISRYNAQKHSILRETATEYEQVDLECIYNDLADDLKPVGRSQELLVEMIAIDMIRLTRLAKSESEVIKQDLSPYHNAEHYVEIFKPAHYEYNPRLWYSERKFGLFSRYQTATQNRIFRCLSALKQLQNV